MEPVNPAMRMPGWGGTEWASKQHVHARLVGTNTFTARQPETSPEASPRANAVRDVRLAHAGCRDGRFRHRGALRSAGEP